MHKILLVEDSPVIQVAVRSALNSVAEIKCCVTLAEARVALSLGKFDLLILDLALPDGDGMSFFAALSRGELHGTPGDSPAPQTGSVGQISFPQVATIFLTGKTDVAEKVRAFSLGAEDYIVKPFHPGELRARVQARLARAAQNARGHGTSVQVGNLTIDLKLQKAFIDKGNSSSAVNSNGNGDIPAGKVDGALDLTQIEFRLLQVFVDNVNQNLPREMLLELVWGQDVNVTERTVDTHVSHLRKKLSTRSHSVYSAHRVGYSLRPRDDKKS